jgi:CBS domain-containing protein
MKPHFTTVGDIKKTNTLSAREETPAHEIALSLLESGFHGMPIIDSKDLVVGKVSEIDLIKALMEGKDLKETAAKEIMQNCAIIIDETTPLEEVAHYMAELHLFRIPVVDKKRHLVGTVTRHDVLRGWLGAIGVTHEGYWG